MKMKRTKRTDHRLRLTLLRAFIIQLNNSCFLFQGPLDLFYGWYCQFGDNRIFSTFFFSEIRHNKKEKKIAKKTQKRKMQLFFLSWNVTANYENQKVTLTFHELYYSMIFFPSKIESLFIYFFRIRYSN